MSGSIAQPASKIIDCIYCGQRREASREHVLTRAFSGESGDWVLGDAVCTHCNSVVFTAYERAWTAAPIFAEARIGLESVWKLVARR